MYLQKGISIKIIFCYCFVGVLKVTGEKSSIRIRIRIRKSQIRIRGAGSVSKCHGSRTMLESRNCVVIGGSASHEADRDPTFYIDADPDTDMLLTKVMSFRIRNPYLYTRRGCHTGTRTFAWPTHF
jgi:hypothetical protein